METPRRHAGSATVIPGCVSAIVGDSHTIDRQPGGALDSNQFWRGPEHIKRQNNGARVSNKGSRKLQRGAAALEFAIVLPILIFVLLGIVDFGMVMGAQTQVSNAAREGARTAALGSTTFKAEQAVKNAISGMPGATNSGTSVAVVCKTSSGVACSLDDSTVDTGGTVTVTLTYVHSWISPAFFGLSPTITLTGQSQMRIE